MYRKINAGASVGHLGGGGVNVKCENVRCLVNIHVLHMCTTHLLVVLVVL